MKTTDERFFKRSRNQPKNTRNWLVFRILSSKRKKRVLIQFHNSFTHVFSCKERGGARRNTLLLHLSRLSSSFETESERKSTFESGREREREKKRKNGENDFGW